MTGVFEPTSSPLGSRLLVEASAGTGKTHAITTLFVRLLLEEELDVERVLVVTFTEAATAELRDRVRSRLRAAVTALRTGGRSGDADLDRLAKGRPGPRRDLQRLELALRNADQASIYTIHSFCHRVLQESAFDSGSSFEQELVTDLEALRDDVVADWWVRELLEGEPERVAWLEHRQITAARGRSLVDRAVGSPELELVPDPEAVGDAGWRERWRACVAEALATWDREEIEALLHRGPLNRTVFKRSRIAGYCSDMAAFLDDPARVPTRDVLARLSASKVRSAEKKEGPPPEHPFFDVCERLLALCDEWERSSRAYAIAFQRGLAEYARAEMPRRKEERGVLSFDDLLQKLWAALCRPDGDALASAVRSRWPAALVDEFQDTDPLQWRIFDTVYRGDRARLMLVGDPKQAIYSFRRADVFAYLAARDSTPREGRYTLTTSWRSGPGLVTAVRMLFGDRPRPFFLEGIDYPEVRARKAAKDSFRAPEPFGDAPFEILFVRRTEEEMRRGGRGGRRIGSDWYRHGVPRAVAAEIAGLLRSGATIGQHEVDAGRIAVLTRTNEQAFEMQAALRRLRVPSVVLGDRSVFGESEARELECVLAAVAEPGDRRAVRAALTTVLLGVSATALAEMDEDALEWDSWMQRFRAWNALWTGRGFVQMVRALLAEAGVQPRLLRLEGGERRLTNLLHLIELMHGASAALHLGPSGLLHWAARQRRAEGIAPDHAQIRLESDERAVKITTVHKAKGLEYDVVYCPYAWSGWLLHPGERAGPRVFHDPADGRAKLDLDPELDGGVRRQLEGEKLAEALRLLYVACTRARHRCTVVWGAFAGFETAALGAALHAPPEPPEDVAQLSRHLERLDDAAMLADLRALAERGGGCIRVREPDREDAGVSLRPPPGETDALVCRRPAKPIDASWRVASFSGLASATPSRGAASDEARERDEEALPELERAGTEGTPIPLASFPRGVRAGLFFHELLEHLDFGAEPPARRALVEAMLVRHGFEAAWTDPVERSLDDVLATVLTGDGLRLADVTPERRLNELEFCLPVASRGRARLTPSRLAAAFAEHPSGALPPGYADRVGRLRFRQLEGYLKGYVDCVVEHAGRYWVIDYKTTHLGDVREGYARRRLDLPMTHGHYFLQYHLYAVAVDRYLRQRVPGYDYETHFGGVLYLFLRGMAPAAGPASGVFEEKPPRARLAALGELCRRMEPAGAGSMEEGTG